MHARSRSSVPARVRHHGLYSSRSICRTLERRFMRTRRCRSRTCTRGHVGARSARSDGERRDRRRPRREVRQKSGDDRDSTAREARQRIRVSMSVDYGGAVTDGLIARVDTRGTLDLVRRQLAEPRAALDSEHRPSERQGDGDVDGDVRRRRRPSWRTASSCRHATSSRRRRRAARKRGGAKRGRFRSTSW